MAAVARPPLMAEVARPAAGLAPMEARIRAALADVVDGHALPRFFYTEPDLFEYERRHMLLDKYLAQLEGALARR